MKDGKRSSGLPSPWRTPIDSAMSAGAHRPVFCSSPMKNVLMEYAVPLSMLNVPAPVELRTR